MKYCVLIAISLVLTACESSDRTDTGGSAISRGSDGPSDVVSRADVAAATEETMGTDATSSPHGSDVIDGAMPIDGMDMLDIMTAPDDAGSGEDATETQDVGTEEPDAWPTTPAMVEKTYSTFIGDWTMAPGKETTKCVVKRLDNTEDVWVSAIHTQLNTGSHHLIIYKSEETEEQPEPKNCTPFTETLSGETVPLMISQIGAETLQFPPGVAFKFEPNQMVRIEAHYLNYYPNDIVAHADIDFDTIAPDDVKAEVNMLFYGTPDLNLPPGEETQTPWHFLDVWEDTTVFALTGHTHAYGTNVEIKFANSKEDEGAEVYPLDQPFDWEEPPVITLDPPITFKSGEGFKYRCTWFNSSDKSVSFGESANKEMCFFWAYYYATPSKGYRMCVNPGNLVADFGDQICCPDSFLCGIIQEFIEDNL